MANYEVTCLGKPGTTYNYIIDGTECIFSSGTVKEVNETLANILKQHKLANGKFLFKVEPINDTVVSKVVEEKVEEFPFSELKEEPIKKDPIKPQLNFKKVDTKKKQDKLI